MEKGQQNVSGFVVLHYLAYDMTCRCMDTLLRSFPGDSIHIALVDNASPDGSGAELERRYAADGRVTVIRNTSNLGFARGNNAGYSYLREHFPCSFITVINNDVLIDDPEFMTKVGAVHSDTGFDVLGPDIVNPASGKHQNPAKRDDDRHLRGYSPAEFEALEAKYSDALRHFKWKRFKWDIKCSLFPSLIRPKATPVPAHIVPRMEGVVLHGACLVFSGHYISVRPQCFNPDTFLYFEEDLLHYECRRDGLRMVYDASVSVKHLEDVTTDEMFRSSTAKDEFKLRESLRSIRVIRALMQSDH